MKVVEHFIAGKWGDSDPECEDMLILADGFVGVLDGATSVDERARGAYDGISPGRFAAKVVSEAIAEFPKDVSLNDAVEFLTVRLRDRLASLSATLVGIDRPSVALAVFSQARREVWRVGDCQIAVNGRRRRSVKAIDRANARARAAYLQELLLQGHEVEELRHKDLGRLLLRPLVEGQQVFRNFPGRSEFAYGAIDGKPVPEKFRECIPVPAEESEIVLASDGYPYLGLTLSAAERSLRRTLRADPLMIGKYMSTKGAYVGQASFDDRCYLRVIAPKADRVGG